MPHQVIDLFAGAGGFGLGFKMAGFCVSDALEVDAWACDTLRQNDQSTNVIQSDIRDLASPASIRNICGTSPALVIGGPPCQGFSIAGPASKDPSDPRNSLFQNFVQWVSVLEPRCFVMENVKGILSRQNAEGKLVIDIIRQAFLAHGYKTDLWLLNAAEYGVPQMRERVFIVGHRLTVALPPPPKTHVLHDNQPTLTFSQGSPALSLWDAISDLPQLKAGEGTEEQPYNAQAQNNYQFEMRNGAGMLFNHVAMSHSARLVERFKHIACGESSATLSVPEEHRARKRSGNGEVSGIGYDQNNRRLHPCRPSHTIAASFYANFIHPYQHRNLTAREGARIQSFPDTYRFAGKKTVISHKLLHREQRHDEKYLCQYNQIGNAVPPLLARAIALHLKNIL